MAKYRSKAMVSRTPDSTLEKLWMKNIWATQPSKSILWEQNQEMLRSSGMVEVVSTRSMAANMNSK